MKHLMNIPFILAIGSLTCVTTIYWGSNNAAAQRINQLKQDSASFHKLYMKANTINKQFRDSVKTNCTCI